MVILFDAQFIPNLAKKPEPEGLRSSPDLLLFLLICPHLFVFKHFLHIRIEFRITLYLPVPAIEISLFSKILVP